MDTAVHPTPGLFVLLDQLTTSGLPLAVATSSRHAYADRLLTRHGLRDRFAFVLASEDVTPGQARPGDLPARPPSDSACRPARCWSWRTARPGWPPREAAGAFAVGVPHEHSPAEGLVDARPHRPAARRPGRSSA